LRAASANDCCAAGLATAGMVVAGGLAGGGVLSDCGPANVATGTSKSTAEETHRMLRIVTALCIWAKIEMGIA
jgi:hypothetical protein